jgi:hypothetical protein
MSTITVRRPDGTSEVVSAALRRGLGPRYHVLPGERSARIPSTTQALIRPTRSWWGPAPTAFFEPR